MSRNILLIIMLLAMGSCVQRRPLKLTVIETCDFHGVVDRRMGSVATYIADSRARLGKNLILLDGGDNLQGTSQVFFSNSLDTASPHIYTTIINSLGYDAIAVGNHDFEVGKEVFSRVYDNIDVPVLSANIIDSRSGKPYFKPYVVIRRGGYKIAVLGLTTKYALEWLPENLRHGFEFQSFDTAAPYWVAEIEKRERPDVIIGLFHSGYYEDVDVTALLSEGRVELLHSASWVAKNVPGFDLICCSHTHELKSGTIVNIAGDTVHLIQGGVHAEGVAEAEITLTPVGSKETHIDISTRTVSTDKLTPDADFMQKMELFMRRATEYDRTPVCRLTHSIESNDEVLHGGSEWVELLHQVLKDVSELEEAGYVGIDVTIAAPSLADERIKAGILTIGDCIKLYPYDNTVSICEMTGEELRQYLEYVYDLRASRVAVNPIYCFDSMSGIDYSVNLDNPKGSRVEVFGMSDGSPCYPTRRYHVAMNSFRAQGGGGHLTHGLGWSKAKMHARCIWESPESMLELMMESFRERKMLDPQPATNWGYGKVATEDEIMTQRRSVRSPSKDIKL